MAISQSFPAKNNRFSPDDVTASSPQMPDSECAKKKMVESTKKKWWMIHGKCTRKMGYTSTYDIYIIYQWDIYDISMWNLKYIWDIYIYMIYKYQWDIP